MNDTTIRGFLFVSIFCVALSVSPSPRAAEIRVGDITAPPASQIQIPIQIDAQADIAVVNARLLYDPAVFSQPTVVPGPLAGPSHTLGAHAPEPGKYNAILYDPAAVTPLGARAGTVFYLNLRVAADAAPGSTHTIGFNHSGAPILPASGLSDLGGVSLVHERADGVVTIQEGIFLPTIETLAVGDFGASTATLLGNLSSTGGEEATVRVYWGVSDGGASIDAWERVENLGPTEVGPFSVYIQDIFSSTTYFYRCHAENISAGGVWADATTSFTTRFVPPLPAPTGLVASDGQNADGVLVTWNPVAGALYYRVYRSDDEQGEKTPLGDWQTATEYEDISATPGQIYYYSARAASGDSGQRASNLSAHDTGYLPAETDFATYKITYKDCDLTVTEAGGLDISTRAPKSWVKIRKMNNPPENPTPQSGVAYLRCATMDDVVIDGDVDKFYTDVQISGLRITGALKSLTAKGGHIGRLEAGTLTNVKMSASQDATSESPTYARSTIVSGSSLDPMKVALSGVILERFQTGQPVKYLKLSTRKHREMVPKQWSVSLGGLGLASRVALEAWGDEMGAPAADADGEGESSLVDAPSIKTISLRGCPMSLDRLTAGLRKITAIGGLFTTASGAKVISAGNIRADFLVSVTDISLLQAKIKKYRGVYRGGYIGYPFEPEASRFLAPNLKKIEGEMGVSGVFVAGFDGLGDPSYKGAIKQIITKKGVIEGEAHVAIEAAVIRFRPEQGNFAVYYWPQY